MPRFINVLLFFTGVDEPAVSVSFVLLLIKEWLKYLLNLSYSVKGKRSIEKSTSARPA